MNRVQRQTIQRSSQWGRAIAAAARAIQRSSGDDAVGLLEWGRRYLPEHFRQPPSKLHRWLADRLDDMSRRRGVKVNLLGPRGAAKSTIGTLAHVLRSVVERREPYVWIVSDTKAQAQAHLENVKGQLEHNRRLAADYPRSFGRGPRWRATTIELANGCVVEAFGTGQRIRGRKQGQHRPTLIVCDDLQNDAHMRSPTQRSASRQWFDGTLLKAGAAGANLIYLATALHRDALAMQLEQTPGWTSALFRSIEQWPQNMDLWGQWEQIYASVDVSRRHNAAREFYEQHRAAMDAGAEVLWPEQEDLYALMQMRVEGGRTAFEREKQNSPIDPERCEWPEEYFGEHIWFSQWPGEMTIRTMALDPSKGADARHGDYSAFVLLGIDREGLLYIEADLARRPTPQMVADGAALCRRFVPDVFGVEANQFQELLAGEFVAEFKRQRRRIVQPVAVYNYVNKLTRIRRLGPYLSQRRLRFRTRSPSTRQLVDQFGHFPLGAHDDGPDAVEMALRLAEEWFRVGKADDGLGRRLPVGDW